MTAIDIMDLQQQAFFLSSAAIVELFQSTYLRTLKFVKWRLH